MPTRDAVFVLIKTSYKIFYILYKEFVIVYNTNYDVSSAICVAESLRAMEYSVGSVEK